MNLINSYTSANSLPFKIFKDVELLKSIINYQKILPRHVQLSPTNKCNLNCSFCSCKLRDLNSEWSARDTDEIVELLVKIGTEAVTITGGGEPLMFPLIDRLIDNLKKSSIKIGLVSNGKILPKQIVMENIIWHRISFSDERNFDDTFISNVNEWSKTKTDLAFSYVLTSHLNYQKVCQIVELANLLNFTHVRLVSDILNPQVAKLMNSVKKYLKISKIDDKLVIYQSRDNYSNGTKKCFISLLKPFIYSDGNIYPCCGSQYALVDEKRTIPNRMKMGHHTDLAKIVDQQLSFNGEICDVCYYTAYNDVLTQLVSRDLKHEEFI